MQANKPSAKATQTTHEQRRHSLPGLLTAPFGLILMGLGIWQGGVLLLSDPWTAHWVALLPCLASILGGIALIKGLYMLQPNEAAILTLFGQYVGSDRSEGLRWANPFFGKRRISLRARNLNALLNHSQN